MNMLSTALEKTAAALLDQAPYLLGLAALFTLLNCFSRQACNPGKSWWKSRDLLTDTHYFFLLPVMTPYLTNAIAILFMLSFWGPSTIAEWPIYIKQGHGILSELPLLAQGVIYVLGSDFLLYWCHRLFHLEKLWPFHAIHHSSEDVDWTTSYRSHPVDNVFRFGVVKLLMMMLGISPEVILILVPFDVISAAFVHSNLNWTLGPLKYVIATPVFHRWHHTAPELGGEANFAPTFSFWDVMFGSFYMPAGELPKEYGVDDPDFPKDFLGQMIYPFRALARNFNKNAA